jgi:aminoglycoside phosphotransferase (APT) family kinase protein
LTASRWHANHVLTIDLGGSLIRVVLRRWARPGWEIDDPDFDARREAAALASLAPTRVSAPELISADPDGAHGDAPSILMTLLPGSPPPAAPEDADRFVTELARALVEVHAVPPGAVPPYRPWHELRAARPPAWVPVRWHRLWELTHVGPPPAEACFIHRDYHHGNTLWSGDRLTGIVDWTTASIGSPGVDVAHARWNLAITHGPEVAESFLEAYRRAVPDYRHEAYWDAAQIVDVLDEPMLGDDFGRLDRYLTGVLLAG